MDEKTWNRLSSECSKSDTPTKGANDFLASWVPEGSETDKLIKSTDPTIDAHGLIIYNEDQFQNLQNN